MVSDRKPSKGRVTRRIICLKTKKFNQYFYKCAPSMRQWFFFLHFLALLAVWLKEKFIQTFSLRCWTAYNCKGCPESRIIISLSDFLPYHGIFFQCTITCQRLHLEQVLGSQAAFGTIFRIMDTATSLKKLSYLISVFKTASKNCI